MCCSFNITQYKIGVKFVLFNIGFLDGQFPIESATHSWSFSCWKSALEYSPVQNTIQSPSFPKCPLLSSVTDKGLSTVQSVVILGKCRFVHINSRINLFAAEHFPGNWLYPHTVKHLIFARTKFRECKIPVIREHLIFASRGGSELSKTLYGLKIGFWFHKKFLKALDLHLIFTST